MKWKKLGNIYNPEKYTGGGYSHGANPFPVKMENSIYRIYYNIRDKENRSNITYLDYDIDRGEILRIAPQPVILPGAPGLFDDSGCSLGCIVPMDDFTWYIYYVGWNLGVTVPWMNYIGLAIYDRRSDTYRKYSPVPIMERNEVDYLSSSYPYVLWDRGMLRMWYGANTKWGPAENDMNHVIKYAESPDGIHWARENVICIEGRNEEEYAFSKPSVLTEDGIYKMWYSYRGTKYRIGYAESADGLRWVRKDGEAGIAASVSGWDSQMLDYPAVFRHAGRKYMLYCGNGYGKTGFGLAVEES